MRSRRGSVSCWTIVGRLAILAAGAAAAPGIAAKVSLDTELSDAEHRVWIAHQQWLVAGSGPGINRVNRGLNPQPPTIPSDVRKQLQAAAWRTLDAAKTVVDELRARLAGSEAPLDAVADLEQQLDVLPGRVTIRWSPVRGALTYTVEINVIGRGTGGDWSLWRYVEDLDATDYTFELGSGPARWRLWAVDARGLGGPLGEWSELVPPQ